MTEVYILEVVIGVAILIFIFLLSLLLREFWTWYWKINKIVEQQDKLIQQNDEIIRVLKSDKGLKHYSPEEAAEKAKKFDELINKKK